MPSRTPDEIRASIEENRLQLAVSLAKLRGEVVVLSDWRRQLVAHQKELTIGGRRIAALWWPQSAPQARGDRSHLGLKRPRTRLRLPHRRRNWRLRGCHEASARKRPRRSEASAA